MTDYLQHSSSSISARNVPEAIDWHDGMLLTSEHFNSMSERQEMLSRYGLAFSQPFAWGVVEANFDLMALADRKLTLSRLEAVMPDGRLVSIGLHDQSVASLDLSLFTDRLATGAAIVYVTVAESGDPALPQEERGDEGDGTLDYDQVYIPRLKPTLSLHIHDTPAGRPRLPVAKIHLNNGSFALMQYVPPTVRVEVDSLAGRICADISAHIREKAQFLVNRLADPSVEANSPLELKTQAQLQGLVSALPAFESLLSTGASHPYNLYVALCNLAGHIAGIASDPIPPVFPKYDHTHILGCFQRISLYVLRTLEQGISERWDVFPFVLIDGVFTLNPSDGWQRGVRGESFAGDRPSLALGLRFSGDVSREAVARWGQTCRIGTRSVLPSLVERRILGVGRAPVSSLEDYYAPKDLALFSLSADREIIKPGEDLQVDNRSETKQPLQVLLYARKPEIPKTA